MTTESLDGKSTDSPSVELRTDNTQSSEAGAATTQTPSRPSRNHLGDHDCHIFAFIGGDKPHFLFSTPAGWGRFYINLAHIKHAAADCAKFVAGT